MRIMTINLRYINDFDEYQWDDRKFVLLEMIRKYNPDVIGFQEAMKEHMEFLEEELRDYDGYGEYRSLDDGAEMNPIFIKGFKFEEKNTIWLSENTEKEYSIGWDACLPRVASYALISAPLEKFIIINTHFDHEGEEARIKSSELILELASKLKLKFNAPVILTGDFNTRPEDGFIDSLLNSSSFKNSFELFEDKENALTIHNFTGEIKGSPIDYIFIDRDIKPSGCEIVRYSKNGIYTSDHWHIICDVE